jgi:hypothetical protein
MAHSNQFRGFRLTGKGLILDAVCPGDSGALTGGTGKLSRMAPLRKANEGSAR